MREDEALKTMSLFEGVAETDRISKSALKNWVVSKSCETLFMIILALPNSRTCVYVHVLKKVG